MTAVILQFPERGREIPSRQLRMTGRLWQRAEMLARAFKLYLRRAPCWRSPACILRAGHRGNCKMPLRRKYRGEPTE